MSDKANKQQSEVIEKIMRLWFTSYGGGDTYDKFTENFFKNGGQLLIPQELPMDEWIYASRIQPPEWLRKRVGTTLPTGILINEG